MGDCSLEYRFSRIAARVRDREALLGPLPSLTSSRVGNRRDTCKGLSLFTPGTDAIQSTARRVDRAERHRTPNQASRLRALANSTPCQWALNTAGIVWGGLPRSELIGLYRVPSATPLQSRQRGDWGVLPGI